MLIQILKKIFFGGFLMKRNRRHKISTHEKTLRRREVAYQYFIEQESIEMIAFLMGICLKTVKRDLRYIKANEQDFLYTDDE